MITSRRWNLLYITAFLVFVAFYNAGFWKTPFGRFRPYTGHPEAFRWEKLPQHYPVTTFRRLPPAKPKRVPKVQYDFPGSSDPQIEAKRLHRLARVRENFEHAWRGYRAHAWGKDEVTPISGGSLDTFGGWAATLVDSLDSLWIMGFKDEFDAAVQEVSRLNFTTAVQEELNVFETTIRYIGGFLSAYDLSGYEVLLHKAVELGNMMYVAFDTPNRMPITRWKWEEARNGTRQEAPEFAISAEIASLSLEFTRLSQLTASPKYFDAIQRITEALQAQQDQTELPGMWPVIVNPRDKKFVKGGGYGLGAMADSLYEYLPKEFMLLGGHHPEYQQMYEKAIKRAKETLFFRPLNAENRDILLSGTAQVHETGVELDTEGQHLVCFVGGMVATAARLFEHPEDLRVARKLVDGCIWAYGNTVTGLMPETFHAVQCTADCNWKSPLWHQAALDRAREDFNGTVESFIEQNRLSPGFADIPDRRYVLRPEAIESIFILYRITGDESLRDEAWKMFQSVEKWTRTDIAHAVIWDVTSPDAPKGDRMETFFTAETLKYYFLLYAEPHIISLDDYVFNTEAHPLKRPK